MDASQCIGILSTPRETSHRACVRHTLTAEPTAFVSARPGTDAASSLVARFVVGGRGMSAKDQLEMEKGFLKFSVEREAEMAAVEQRRKLRELREEARKQSEGNTEVFE